MTPEDNNVIDLFQATLTNLERVEGLSKEEYLRKAVNAEKEFAHVETDDD